MVGHVKLGLLIVIYIWCTPVLSSNTFIDVTSPPYNAIPDDELDDSDEIQAALNSGFPVYFPPGEYNFSKTLITDTAVTIKGSGAGKTFLVFDLDDGVNGVGIHVKNVVKNERTIAFISDFTIKTKKKGKHAIFTSTGPLDSGMLKPEFLPTYHIERIKFTGYTADSSEIGLYEEGWIEYIYLGDGYNHVIRDVEIFGSYNYKTDTPNNDTAIVLTSEFGNLMPIVEHVFVHHVPIAINMVGDISNPYISNSQFHRVNVGIRAADSIESYETNEIQLSKLNINAQSKGIHIDYSSMVDIANVRITRAVGGIEVGDWIGIALVTCDDYKIISTRIKDLSSYSGNDIGIYLDNSDFGYIAGLNVYGGVNVGIKFKNSDSITISGANFMTGTDTSLWFQGAGTKNITIVGDNHGEGVTPAEYYSTDSSLIKFIR